MDQFEKGVPFDLGLSNWFISFPDYVKNNVGEPTKLKSINQIKFKLSQSEHGITKYFEKCASVFLGCMLWGGYLSAMYKDNPKEILNNPVLDLSDEEFEKREYYSNEPTYIIEYLNDFDRKCRFYLKRPFKINDQLIDITNNYIKFVEMNNNFRYTRSTSDIKLPDALNHFQTLTKEKLDELYILFSDIIKSDKIENLLNIGYYQ